MSNMIGKLILFLFVATTACASEKVVFAKVTSEDMKTAIALECPSDVYDKMFRWDPVTGADYSIKKVCKLYAKLDLEQQSQLSLAVHTLPAAYLL